MAHLRILALDDSKAQLGCISHVLRASGHAVVTTSSVTEVQRELGQRRFDLVIVDFHMPGMNGDEALEQIKSAPILGSPRFYLYTTDLTVGAIDVALGFDGALVAKGNADLLQSQIDGIAKQLLLQLP